MVLLASICSLYPQQSAVQRCGVCLAAVSQRASAVVLLLKASMGSLLSRSVSCAMGWILVFVGCGYLRAHAALCLGR